MRSNLSGIHKSLLTFFRCVLKLFQNIELLPTFTNLQISCWLNRSQIIQQSEVTISFCRSFVTLWTDGTLLAQMGVEHRVITNTGIAVRIFGLIDLCVTASHRGEKIATTLLQQVEALGRSNSVDFLLLFADDARLYLENGYERANNTCRWMKVDEHQTLGIGEESMSDCMLIKQIGEQKWQTGIVDLLGYLF